MLAQREPVGHSGNKIADNAGSVRLIPGADPFPPFLRHVLRAGEEMQKEIPHNSRGRNSESTTHLSPQDGSDDERMPQSIYRVAQRE